MGENVKRERKSIALFQGYYVGNCDVDELNNPTASDALHGAGCDQPLHTLSSAAQGRADEEDNYRSVKDWLSACKIREFSVERRKGSRSQKIRASIARFNQTHISDTTLVCIPADPAIILAAPKVRDDNW